MEVEEFFSDGMFAVRNKDRRVLLSSYRFSLRRTKESLQRDSTDLGKQKLQFKGQPIFVM